jgi:microcystin-dependent protein
VPDLDRLFAPSRPNTPPAFAGSQAWEARVTKVTRSGVFVVIPGYDRTLEWGPCLPPGSSANVGETVTVAMTNRGRPWLLGAGGGGGGSATITAARAYLTATFVTPENTWTKIPLDTVAAGFDPANLWEPTNHRFVAKTAGFYQVNGCIQWGTSVWTGFTQSAIYKNGVNVARGAGVHQTDDVGVRGRPVADLIHLNAGDYVELWGYSYVNFSLYAGDPTNSTYLSLAQITAGSGPKGDRGPQGPPGNAQEGVDVGDVKLTARETAPAGWLLCRGQEIGRVEYVALFEAIGTFYGAGDGASTFNVPDLRDRVAVGAWSEAVGAVGGAATVALSHAEMPHHNHAGVTHAMDRNIDHLHGGATNGADRSLAHGHAMFWGQVAGAFDRQWGGGTFAQLQTVAGGVGWWGGDGMRTNDEGSVDHLHSFTTGGADRSLDHLHGITAEGGSGAHNNMQPYQRLNYVIKF